MSDITKTAMVTVCGRPNVGKSSLTNALVGEKVAIVSNKAQTTRNRICGVVNRGDTQIVLMDTPGLHKPKSALGDYKVKVVAASLSDVDAALLLVEPIAHVGAPELALIRRIREDRQIHKAQQLLAKSQGCSEEEAYRRMRKAAMDKRVSVASLAERILQQAAKTDDVAAVKAWLDAHKGFSGERAYQYIVNYGKSRGCSVEEAAKKLRDSLPAEK